MNGIVRVSVGLFLLIAAFLYYHDTASVGLVSSLCVGVPLFCLALVVNKNNWLAIVRAYVLGFMFAFLSPLFVTQPSDRYRQKFGHYFVGAIAGCFVAGLITLYNRKSLEVIDELRNDATAVEDGS